MEAVVGSKVNLQGFASSNARMSCPRATKNDVMLAIKEVGYEYKNLVIAQMTSKTLYAPV
jgi:hypothetical protein